MESLVELWPTVLAEDDTIVDRIVRNTPIQHPRAIVVSQDCDLEWDYKARQGQAPSAKILQHVFFCDLFELGEIRNRDDINSRIFEWIKSNQHARFHHLDGAGIEETGQALPELFADFKATFSLPTEYAYWLFSSGLSIRKGFLPVPYVQDFAQRLYSFLARVALS